MVHAPDLAGYRLLADGRCSVLLRRDGGLDWWCAPELDSAPLLWRLLDPSGPAARWRGVRVDGAGGPPAGPVLATLLRAGRTRVQTRDGLLSDGSAAPALVRLVRALDSDLDLCHELSAGLLGAPNAPWRDGTADLPTGCVRVRGGVSHASDGGLLRTALTAPRGEWTALVVGFDPLPAYDVLALLGRMHELACAAEDGVAAARLTRHCPHRSTDALRVLTALTHPLSGAAVAAPTTSLPEAPGADRQFDYRYSWLRDCSLAVSVASLLGRPQTARGYLDFACRQLAGDPLATPPVLDVRGAPVPGERTVDGVAGWADSRPVRVGNDAGGQRQPGALGLVVEAVSVHLQTGGVLDDAVWRTVARTANAVAGDVLREPVRAAPTAGIWELREPQQLVEEDIGRWIALDRALWIARGWRPLARRRGWRRARTIVRDRVLHALDDDGGLPQSYAGIPAGAMPPR